MYSAGIVEMMHSKGNVLVMHSTGPRLRKMLQFLVVRVSYCVPARPAGENNAPIIRPKIPPNKRPASPRVYNK